MRAIRRPESSNRVAALERSDNVVPRPATLSLRFSAATFGVMAAAVVAWAGAAEHRFPPPEFEGGHKLPVTTTPVPRTLLLQYVDVAVLLAALGVALWLIYRRRSRRGVLWLSVFSLAYFGFYRDGCICAIGTIQNLALGIADPGYTIPITVLVFFLAPIVVALFGGRAFCAGVCPHGALQDLVLLKPVKVPGWLEHSLGLVPFLFLGAGVAFAATGSAFIICRYDPFVPLFRLSGSLPLLTLGAAFLLVGVFVGRPYCRFLCPYGALLRMAAVVSKWRVRVTPDYCTQCRLCEHSCPYGAMREPVAAPTRPESAARQRRRLALLLLALPFLIAAGALAGSRLGVPASRLHPTVALAELRAEQQRQPQAFAPMTFEALALERAEHDPAALEASARELRRRFTLAGWLFGGWAGLVIGFKLLALALRTARTDYEPDRGTCFACARCFESCPNERVRRGLMPPEALAPPPGAAAGTTAAAAPAPVARAARAATNAAVAGTGAA